MAVLAKAQRFFAGLDALPLAAVAAVEADDEHKEARGDRR
jgi:hypothetical protein